MTAPLAGPAGGPAPRQAPSHAGRQTGCRRRQAASCRWTMAAARSASWQAAGPLSAPRTLPLRPSTGAGPAQRRGTVQYRPAVPALPRPALSNEAVRCRHPRDRPAPQMAAQKTGHSGGLQVLPPGASPARPTASAVHRPALATGQKSAGCVLASARPRRGEFGSRRTAIGAVRSIQTPAPPRPRLSARRPTAKAGATVADRGCAAGRPPPPARPEWPCIWPGRPGPATAPAAANLAGGGRLAGASSAGSVAAEPG